jgi:hypothetical protein
LDGVSLSVQGATIDWNEKGVGKDACKYYDDLAAAGDEYGKIAAKACRGEKVEMGGVTVDWIKDGPWSRCIRKCLLEWEYACAKNDQPCGMNPCRNVAHIGCYSKCSFLARFKGWEDFPQKTDDMYKLGGAATLELLQDISNKMGGEYKLSFGKTPSSGPAQ